MSYFKTYVCGGILESSDLIEFIKSKVSNWAQAPQLNLLNGGSKPKPNSTKKVNQQMSNAEAAKVLAVFSAKILVGHFISYFVDLKLSQLAVKTVEKNKKNKRLLEFLEKEADKVYRKHPDNTSCSAKQFMNSSIYEYMVSEYREKSAKEVGEILAYKSLDNLITIVLGDKVPIPGSTLLALPIKMVLINLGLEFPYLSSLYNIAAEVGGNTFSFGINYKKIGFTLTNIILYTFDKDGKMIATKIKTPPESLYRITTDDAREILHKYGEDKNIDLLKKEVKKANVTK